MGNRPQCVKIGNTCSDWQYIKRGVPQGSKVGPLLFNFFINDLILSLETKCDVYNYADDNTISFHGCNVDTVVDVLQTSVDHSLNWFKANNMKANPQKFQCMLLSRSNVVNDISFTFYDTILKPQSEVKMLGVVLDNKLSFRSHVQTLCKKIASKINSMYRLTVLLSVQSKLKLYNSFIMSHFNFCCTVYHFCTVGDSRKLEKLNARALRIVYNDYISTYAQLLRKNRQHCLYAKREMLLVEQVFKILYNCSPPIVPEFFTVLESPYDLRNSKCLVQRKCNSTTFGTNTLKYLGSKLWNQLPNNLKLEIDFISFKTLLGKIAICECNNYCLKCNHSM